MTVHPLPRKPAKPPKAPRAPLHLSKKTREWWQRIVESYEFQDFELRLLTAAGEAWDRKESARQVIEKEGLTYLDRFGQPATRPEVAVERDSRLAFFRCMRQLALSEEPPDDRPKPLKFGGRK
jgi:P27 family predicted phage terminase small subunit